MSPSVRVNLLLAGHGLLMYGNIAAAFLTDYRATDWPVVFGWLFWLSQMNVSGLIIGLATSYQGAPRSRMPDILTRAWIALAVVWLPCGLFAATFGNAPEALFVPVLLGGFVLGLAAATTSATLRTFSLRLGDASGSAAATPAIQFSLRHLIIVMTLAAAVCGVPRLLFELQSDTPLDDLIRVLFVLYCALMIFVGLWIFIVAVPLLSVFLSKRPWLATIAAIGFIALLVAGALFALGARAGYDYVRVALLIGSYFGLVMASLAVLRSCGLRLVRRSPNDANAVDLPDFSTWPFDNRPPKTNTDVPEALNTPTSK